MSKALCENASMFQVQEDRSR